jgi:uncharacterized membrane protein
MGFVRAGLCWLVAGIAGCAGPGETGLKLENTEGALTRADWCDARAVILDKCTRCHAARPRNGAPFSLVTFADTQEPAPAEGEPERTRAERMLHAVKSGTMPFTGFLLDPPVEKLTCEERATLLDWLENGAQAPVGGDESCEEVSPRLLECSGGEAGAGGERG